MSTPRIDLEKAISHWQQKLATMLGSGFAAPPFAGLVLSLEAPSSRRRRRGTSRAGVQRRRIEPPRSHALSAMEVSHELASASALRAQNRALRLAGKQTAELTMLPCCVDEGGLAPALVGDGDGLSPLRIVVQHTTLHGHDQHSAHVAQNRQPARRPRRFTRNGRLLSEASFAAKSLQRINQCSIHRQRLLSRCKSTSEPRWTSDRAVSTECRGDPARVLKDDLTCIARTGVAGLQADFADGILTTASAWDADSGPILVTPSEALNAHSRRAAQNLVGLLFPAR